ncbi:hypothetical protein PENSOL_c116G08147 [Penicillium solitum]|uniref:Uncharacterized protein n=1 Tax=Penicillium solitum TaxID=60172 RepID=A0A1V6Q6C7_9EURO|nr:uncharacterized protein PENSOL_c116G08147 [Penicillium solitum]OQD84784.1 hypothetical protein PENSOL_c116G08147 [Penicillium solitum]
MADVVTGNMGDTNLQPPSPDDASDSEDEDNKPSY